MSWFDFLTFLGEEMTRVRLKSQQDTVWKKKWTAKNKQVDGLIFTVYGSRFMVYGCAGFSTAEAFVSTTRFFPR